MKAQAVRFADWDLDSFDRLLEAHVTRGRVDYGAFAASAAFAAFIEQTGRVDRDSLRSPAARLVFYINSYNALTIRAVTQGLSPQTLPGRLRFFVLTRFPIAGERLSLLRIERGRLIPLGEPRAHFPIVCASGSCPVLQSYVYRVATLQTQLEDAAREFINDQEQNRFDPSTRTATLSRIFKWYRREFERQSGSLQRFLSGYVEDGAIARLLDEDGFSLRFRPYDWSLNAA